MRNNLRLLLLVPALTGCLHTETDVREDARPDHGVADRAGGDHPRGDHGSRDLAATTGAPQIAPAVGTHACGTPISITAEPQARIYYSLNGGDPTPASKEYLVPFKLTGQTPVLTVRAIAVAPGKRPSSVSTTALTLQKGVIIHFKKPAGWTDASLHYWSTVPGGLQTTWPGVAMSPDGGGWYSFSLKDQTAVHLVFKWRGQGQGGLRLELDGLATLFHADRGRGGVEHRWTMRTSRMPRSRQAARRSPTGPWSSAMAMSPGGSASPFDFELDEADRIRACR